MLLHLFGVFLPGDFCGMGIRFLKTQKRFITFTSPFSGPFSINKELVPNIKRAKSFRTGDHHVNFWKNFHRFDFFSKSPLASCAGKTLQDGHCPSALQDWPNSCNLNLYEDGRISVLFLSRQKSFFF